MKFDEINSLEEYFAPMEISDSDKARRIELAELLMDVVLLFFSTFLTFSEHGKAKGKEKYFTDFLNDKFEDAVLTVTGIDDYTSKHIKSLSKEIVDTTYKHCENDSSIITHSSPSESESSVGNENENFSFPTNNNSLVSNPADDPQTQQNSQTDSTYWLSEKRAFLIAGNEANSILNYSDYAYAVYEGNTQKQWLTMEDEKVRMSHAEINGQIIGINDLFVVGDSVMRFPHDTEYGATPQEIIGCRCTVRYF